MRAGRREPAGGLGAVFLDGAYEETAYYRRWALAADLVVAADGGARFLESIGVVPDILVGDFDSLDEESVAAAAARGARVARHPVRKDETDGELAAGEALRVGVAEIVLAGALGALDHVLGHLALLAHLEGLGTPARLVSPALTASVLRAPARVRLAARPGTRVSLVPGAGDAVATLSGFAYELDRGVLPHDRCLGLGNTVTGEAVIDVHEGRLAALVFEGAETFGRCRAVDVPGTAA